ncbi:hypothetical protein ACFX2A_001545 [Malus domestica]
MADDDGKLSIFSSNNEDIIVEILSWLPVICLLRFRCVCKSWGALISTPHFFDKHRPCTNDNDNNKNVLILFNRSPRRADYWESHDSLPSRFPQLTDYQSLKNKKNVAASASAATAASLSRRRNLEDEFPDDTSVRDSSLAGSCNGLICLLGKYEGVCELRDMFIKWYGNNRLLLWNPSTRKARKLPDIDCFRFGSIYYRFGYDSTTQD